MSLLLLYDVRPACPALLFSARPSAPLRAFLLPRPSSIAPSPSPHSFKVTTLHPTLYLWASEDRMRSVPTLLSPSASHLVWQSHGLHKAMEPHFIATSRALEELVAQYVGAAFSFVGSAPWEQSFASE